MSRSYGCLAETSLLTVQSKCLLLCLIILLYIYIYIHTLTQIVEHIPQCLLPRNELQSSVSINHVKELWFCPAKTS